MRYQAHFGLLLVISLALASIGPGTVAAPVAVRVAAAPDNAVICTVTGGCVAAPVPPMPPMPPVSRGVGPRVAATYTVTATGEPASGTDATCAATCTLQQAVNASNANDPGAGNTNTIAFSATFASAQTITLSSTAGFGTLVLVRPVTITGPGATLLTIDGGCTDCGAGKANTSGTGVGVFAINSAIAVAFSGLTIANGNAGFGGAISNNGGTVTITNCAVTNNHAVSNGGAIYHQNGTLTITGSTFTGNVSSTLGGAILSLGASAVTVLAVTGSTFTGNQASGDGGAINNNNASTATITASTFTGNSAGNGSAIITISRIVATPARLTLANSTLSGNTVTGLGGTVLTAFAFATTVIAGSTISGNTAAGGSSTGGVLAFSGGVVTLTDTILAGNTATGISGSPDLFSTAAGTPFNGTNNLIGVGDASTHFTGLTNGVNGNQVGTTATPLNPQLGSLARNGGPVQTRALLVVSPAINTGVCAYTDVTGAARTLATDARGIGRPQGINCDIGSYEALPSPQPFTVTRAADDASDANCNPAASGGCTLRQALNASYLTTGTATNTITFDPTAFPTGSNSTITLLAASGGALTLSRAVTITGPGLTALTVSGNHATQVFVVNGGITATISGMTITAGNSATANGGAISVINTGVLTLTDSAVTASHTSAFGGGIFTDGTLTVQRVTVSNNQGDTGAGGIGAGGAGTVRIEARAILNNGTFGSSGGGIAFFNILPDGIVTNTTIAGNSAAADGGGISYQGKTLALANVTVTSNHVTLMGANGGGIALSAGGVTLNDSIVSGNTATINPDLAGPFAGGNNFVGGNALLAPLALYAPGTTRTYPLLPGSPAIDAGVNPTCAATDQRGVSRPQPAGGACDLGAFESRGFTLGTLTGNTQGAGVTTAFVTPLGLTVASANSEPVAGGLVTFTIISGSGGTSAVFGAVGSTGCTLTGPTVAACPGGPTGLVTTPPLTANGTPGSFTISAHATGAPTVTYTETVNLALALPPARWQMPAPACPTARLPPPRGARARDTFTPSRQAAACPRA